ncbi:MAG: hypothetical protein HY686_05080 [Chloroflexi bacterium]|nr:hypothetical protein [Chloroflexota bacterium]
MKHLLWIPALLTALMLAIAPAASPTFADQPTTLSGVVVNGTPGGGVPAGLEVTLHILKGEQAVESRTALLDSEGRFTFEALPGGEGTRYVLLTVYQTAGYVAEPAPAKEGDPVVLRIYESASSLEDIRIRSNVLLITDPDPGRRSVAFLEMVVLENVGTRTVVPGVKEPASMTLLRFSLPPGAQEFHLESDLVGGDVLQVDRGFAVTSPVPPGTHQLLFAYRTPYQGSELAVTRRFPLGADAFRVLVPQPLAAVKVSGLQEQPSQEVEKTSYQSLLGQQLTPESVVQLTLRGLPKASPTQGVQNVMAPGRYGIMALASLLGMALLAILGYALLRRRARAPALASAASPAEREALVAAIARLDDSFARGELSEAEHQRRRGELKTRLLEQALQEKGEEPPTTRPV